MKFKLEFPIDPICINLNFDNKVLLIGSCFSDEMGEKFISSGFNVCDNPFGTLFHPMAISRVLKDSIHGSEDVDVLSRGDLYFSWDASGKLYDTDKDRLLKKISDKRKEVREVLLNAELAVITFGTAWAYVLKENEKVVANCHKVPQDRFNRALTDIEVMISEWAGLLQEIRDLNPQIEIVLTVSPVRHVRDGLVENNRSKARLIEAVNALTGDHVHYFPSYEILIDELRDYRFYSGDLVHPAKEATSYIWDRFKTFLFDQDTSAAVNTVEKVKRSLAHKSLYPESAEETKRREVLEAEMNKVNSLYIGINWE